MRQVVHLVPYRFAGTWLVAPRSHLMDRFIPQVELIRWPGGVYTVKNRDLVLTASAEPETRRPPRLTRRARIRLLGRNTPVDLGAGFVIDHRAENFFNWAHHLLTYLPLSLLLRERLAPSQPVTALFHATMPAIILALYRQFGFEAIATDAPVRATFLEWHSGDLEAVSTRIHEMVRPYLHYVSEPAEAPARAHPKKIFLSRRGGRAIANAPEIEAILAEHGYTTLYAEDFPGLEQIALIRNATDIAAIHGAALGPLLYREPDRPFTLLEILPVGHMIGCYRMICDQLGGRYCAVRGRIRRDHLPALYAAAPFLGHSNEAFEVCPDSVRVALEILARGDIIDDYPDRWPFGARGAAG